LNNAALPVGSSAAVDFAMTASGTSVPGSGYYRSSGELDLFNSGAVAPLRYAWAAGNNVDLGVDPLTGNRARYVVERMCDIDWLNAFPTGTKPTDRGCLFTQFATSGSRKGGFGRAATPDQALVFRVTVRVDGPRNTTVYLQGFVY
jgi:hypothetical protein